MGVQEYFGKGKSREKWFDKLKSFKNQRQQAKEIEVLPIRYSEIIILPEMYIARIYEKYYLIQATFDIYTLASSNQSFEYFMRKLHELSLFKTYADRK